MWNGTGIFERIHEWVKIKLNAERLDQEFINVKKGLEHCLTRNGETGPTKDLNMTNLKHINVGAATARNQYASAGDVQDQKYNYGDLSSGDANEYKIKLSFDERKLTEGQVVYFTAHQSNTGPAKLKINKAKSKMIVKRGDKPLVAKDILEDAMISAIYDGDQFQLLSHVTDPVVHIPDQIAPIRNQLVPSGSMIAFAGVSIPAGWIECAGQVLNATTHKHYQPLFTVIGNTYGGTGIADFKLPDLRGRIPCGQDNMGGPPANRVSLARGGIKAVQMGAVGGSATHTLTLAEIPSHTHTSLSNGTGKGIASPVGRFGHTVESGPAGGGQAHNNMPPIIITKMIIKL